jgi:2TM domain-containing protein
MTHQEPSSDQTLREEALRSLRKKRHFRSHVVAYILVNSLLVGIWAVTGADYFWPIFPIAGWGIGLAFNAWDVYGRRPITEAQIEEEQRRLSQR